MQEPPEFELSALSQSDLTRLRQGFGWEVQQEPQNPNVYLVKNSRGFPLHFALVQDAMVFHKALRLFEAICDAHPVPRRGFFFAQRDFRVGSTKGFHYTCTDLGLGELGKRFLNDHAQIALCSLCGGNRPCPLETSTDEPRVCFGCVSDAENK